jgi:4-hydroxybenzoate polyprenyltransferase
MTAATLLRFSRVVEILKYSYPILVALGIAGARVSLLDPHVWWAVAVNLVIFVFVHMINDLEDAEDDARDPAKAVRNPVASGELAPRTAGRVVLVTGIGASVMLSPFPFAAQAVGLSVMLVGVLYSWRPVRPKARPVVDLLTHGYMLAAGQILFFAFLEGATLDAYTLLLAAGAFVFSMGGDLYNEIRDWGVDRDAGLGNTAGLVGYARARLLMLAFYATGAATVGVTCAMRFGVLGRLGM